MDVWADGTNASNYGEVIGSKTSATPQHRRNEYEKSDDEEMLISKKIRKILKSKKLWLKS